MARLEAIFSKAFSRDLKRIARKRLNEDDLAEVIDLILENTPDALEELRRRHRMHSLHGEWAGNNECHVCNAGDWLLVWYTNNGIAYMQRTGTHDEIFR